MVKTIEKKKAEMLVPAPIFDNYKIFEVLEPRIELNWDLDFYYSTYVMAVFSFIEHIAVLILPFWFALREEKEYPYWNSFCQELSKDFETYWDFWIYRKDWLSAFVNTLCTYIVPPKVTAKDFSAQMRMNIRLSLKNFTFRLENNSETLSIMECL